MFSTFFSFRHLPAVSRLVVVLLFLVLIFGFGATLQLSAADEPTADVDAATDGVTAVAAPFDIIDRSPSPSAYAGVTLTNTVSATFNGNLEPSSVPANFIVQGQQQGRFNGSLQYDSGTRILSFAPDRPFLYGEQIRVTASGGMQSTAADPLTPYQWSFQAGYIQKRCIEGFLPINEFVPVWSSTTDWGDYDRDGDLDAIIAGKPLIGNPITRIYRNNDGHFQQLDYGLVGVREGAVAWGDYDNDYDLDLLVAGADTSGIPVTRLYRNENGASFSAIGTNLPAITRGGVNWVDYNNDGRLDIFLHGDSSGSSIARLYRNDGNSAFTQVTTNFPGINNSSTDWADYDNDGDLDLLLTGINNSVYVSRIYNNDNGTFTDIGAGLQAIGDSAVAWGDYDGDGDEDIVMSGETNPSVSAPISRIYRNDNGIFTNIGAPLHGVLDGVVAWGDFDNDGDLDLLVSGKDNAENVSTRLYQNQGGSFSLYPTNFPGINLGSVSWGDFDGDYDLDILLAGFSVSETAILAAGAGGESIVTTLYRNYDCPSDVSIQQTIVPTTLLTTEPVTPEPITITLEFHNAGPVTATNVILEDLIPNEISVSQIVSTTSAGIQIADTGANPPYRWRISDLLVGQGGTITITGQLNPSAGAVYSNTAEISADKDVTLTDNIATAQVVVPFHVVQTSPGDGDKVGAALDSTLGLTFETSVRQSDLNEQSLYLYGDRSGRIALTDSNYDGGSRTYEFRANRDLMQGELVSVIGTDAIRSIPGAPLIAYQWQFIAGETLNRCVGDFAAIDTEIPDIDHGAAAWGDYDGDGDIDLAIAGQIDGQIVSRIYRNDGNERFTNSGISLIGVRDGTVQWIDYDADGDLDLFLTGTDGSNPVAALYLNHTGSFGPVSTSFTPVTNSAAAWFDYDNDGFLDLVLSGLSSGGRVTQLYRNNSGTSFTQINAGLPGRSHGAVATADYDNDGDLDLILTGTDGSNPQTALYRNDSGVFVDSGAGLGDVTASAVAWGDYDRDGDPDLLISGYNGSANSTQLYRNDDGVFNTVATSLPAIANGSVAWADLDNDRQLDVVISGETDSGRVTALYRQQNGTFEELSAVLTAVSFSNVALGDYDGDRDLDLLSLGNDGSSARSTLYRNTDCISDLGVIKSASSPIALPGETITYTIVFTNAGPQPALNVVVSDSVPTDLINLQFTNTPIGAGVVMTETVVANGRQWLVSDLGIGEGGIITVTGEVLTGTAGSVFTNRVTVTATHDITPTNNLGIAPVGRPFHITETLPAAGAVGVALNGTFTATFDADVNLFTATDQTLVVYGSQSGWREGIGQYDEANRRVIFVPTKPLHHGEEIDVIGTAGVKSLAGAPLDPYQWHFVAGDVDPERCLAGFERKTVPFPALTKSSAAWADYDGDRDLDLLVAGSTNGTSRVTKLYRNDGNSTFAEVAATFAAVHSGAVAWGDYDHDGDPDIALTGSGSGGPIAKIYQNNSGVFSDISASLTGVSNSAVAWGDYDNDGDLDLIIAGTTDGANGLTRIYRNDSGSFSSAAISLPGLYHGSVQWGDYDADGDLDILLAGTSDGTNAATHLYRNNGNDIFVNSGAALPGIFDGVATWTDYDGDQDLDLFLTGQTTGATRAIHLLRNDGVAFTDVTANSNFVAVDQATAKWGDYDNNGTMDLVVAGTADGGTPLIQLMANIGNDNFLDAVTEFDAISSGAVLWSDYDGDRDLDLFLSGSATDGPAVRLYRSRDCISDLDIAYSVSPTSILPGEQVTYTITYANIGPQVATRVVLTDLMPFEFLSDFSVDSTTSLTQIGPPYIWQLPNVAPGTGGSVTIRAKASYLSLGNTIHTTATISAREDLTPTNNVGTTALTVRAPTLNFVAATADVDEDAGVATIRVTLNEPNYAGNVFVDYQSAGGTAFIGGDYAAVNSTLTIPAGETEASFMVSILEDTLDEANETIQLKLSNPVGALLGATSEMVLSIVDNDALPTLSFSGSAVAETDGVVEFDFLLSNASGRLVTLTVNTVNGTATAPEDFVALVDHQVVIPIGAKNTTVSVSLVDDTLQEEVEEFYLAVSVDNATLVASQASATISDNDEFRLFMPVIRRSR